MSYPHKYCIFQIILWEETEGSGTPYLPSWNFFFRNERCPEITTAYTISIHFQNFVPESIYR